MNADTMPDLLSKNSRKISPNSFGLPSLSFISTSFFLVVIYSTVSIYFLCSHWLHLWNPSTFGLLEKRRKLHFCSISDPLTSYSAVLILFQFRFQWSLCNWNPYQISFEECKPKKRWNIYIYIYIYFFFYGFNLNYFFTRFDQGRWGI